MHALWLAVALMVKIVDQPGALALTGGRVDDFSIVATWLRVLDQRKIPVAERGLFLTVQHPKETYADCAVVGLVSDRGPVPATVQIERGGLSCGPEGRETFTLRIARADLPAIKRARTLALDLCGTQLAMSGPWLEALRRLVARALSDK